MTRIHRNHLTTAMTRAAAIVSIALAILWPGWREELRSQTYYNRVSDNFGVVGGGNNNQAGDNAGTTSDSPYATVGGGFGNKASGELAIVGGGGFNTASGVGANVGGGGYNTASNGVATVGGGSHNTASGQSATVGGGDINNASNANATVGGGYFNSAGGPGSTVGGGSANAAAGPGTTVGGGGGNIASGQYATVPGGSGNIAQGAYSFAIGRRALAYHQGAFVWGDSTTDAGFASTADNQFLIRASGGVGIGTTAPAAALDVAGSVKASGTLILPNTIGASTGVITLGSNRFLHNYGTDNTFVGTNAGNFTMTGFGNTASGGRALQNNTTGYDNTASGVNALYSNTTGFQNTASGRNALFSNTDGGGNTASGYSALYSNTTGYFNTASGYAALNDNTSGYNNTAAGAHALLNNTTGYDNTALGRAALEFNTAGSWNTASGYGALVANSTGDFNTANGLQALSANTSGKGNTASGAVALLYNTSGNNNTALGVQAGATSVPFGANANTTGSNNTFIGSNSGPGVPSSANLQNATAIGANAVVSASNSLVLGSINGVNGATSDVNVGIGTASPEQKLDVNGNVAIANNSLLYFRNAAGSVDAALSEGPANNLNFIPGSGGFFYFNNHANNAINLTITDTGSVGIGTSSPSEKLHVIGNILASGTITPSSRRLKTNIQTLQGALEKVEGLRGVTFNWKETGKRDVGLIAEEVGEVVPEVVAYEANGVDAKGIDYARLVSVLVEAVKEQQAQIRQLQSEVEGLKARMGVEVSKAVISDK